jgi:DNA integrity scanning protein DisA with diadenylate cyclase activity
MPDCRLTADFREGYGFLRFAGEPVCTFSGGKFDSTTRRANLVHLEELLLESPMDPSRVSNLFRSVSSVVNKAREKKHGCTIVIDFNDPLLNIPGQHIHPPLDLEDEEALNMSQSLAKVDGALHVGSDSWLYAFACLLDGHAVPGENLARGARFNSALRYTAEHDNIVIVVVSSDKPVSVIKGGVELSAQCEWIPFSKSSEFPPTLEGWLEG